MKRIVVIILAFCSVGVMGQGIDDIYRLSHLNAPQGTARFTGMGGAFGALGADFSSLSQNPAGIAMYRSSELMLTPSLKNRIDETRYIGNEYRDSRNRFMFDNFGFVSSLQAVKKEDEKGLMMLNFGIGYNRVKDLYFETSLYGLNKDYSIADYFAKLATDYEYRWQNLTHDPDGGWDPYFDSNAWWEAIMAWNTFLIDTVAGKQNEYESFLYPGDAVYQEKSISSEGGIGEYTFSMGANLSNKFYWGATIGVHDVYIRYYTYYTEVADAGNNTSGDIIFQGMNFNERLLIEGSGVNLKAGFIYRPIPQLRLGIAAHTPTFYKLNERFRASMESDMNIGNAKETTPTNYYDYRIESPYRLIGSLAYTFGQIGLISADYEYVDYSSMRFGKGGDGYRFKSENQDINRIFTNSHNVRVGGEAWIRDLALRAGYAYYGGAYKQDEVLAMTATNVFSGGFGLRLDNFYVDWAYQRVMFDNSFMPFGNPAYLNMFPQLAKMSSNQNRFLLTLGYKF